MEREPRTSTWIPVKKIVQKRGKYPFILRHIGTNQIGVTQEIWMEVPVGSVRLYNPGYDPCSRFKTENECRGPGLNNSLCVFKQGKCRAEYSFGKKIGTLSKDIKYLNKIFE